jgi:hypothetical protein
MGVQVEIRPISTKAPKLGFTGNEPIKEQIINES